MTASERKSLDDVAREAPWQGSSSAEHAERPPCALSQARMNRFHVETSLEWVGVSSDGQVKARNEVTGVGTTWHFSERQFIPGDRQGPVAPPSLANSTLASTLQMPEGPTVNSDKNA